MIVAPPANGAVNGVSPNFSYISNSNFSGVDSFTYRATDAFGTSASATVAINVTNTAPTVTASGSPTLIIEGQSVSFSATGTDPDGDALTYSWDFGDGSTSTQQNPSHAYSAAGTYNAVVTVTDIAGATATATVVVNVFRAFDQPTARFTTSAVVGIVNVPLLFDAGFSTDPQNAIVNYSWTFGDGSPAGGGQVISRAYGAEGVYRVTLTVTDATGLTGTAARDIQIVSQEQADATESFLTYSAKVNRATSAKDSLTLVASVNVGDNEVGPGTNVACEIGGVRFEGTLDVKLRDSSSSTEKWQVKANTRKQAAGDVLLKLSLKKATLANAFAAVYAATAEDDEVDITIPIKLEIGARTIEVGVPSNFLFDKTGNKIRGDGETE